MADATAWLVEKGSAPLYATVDNGFFRWTRDIECALRLSRREDAEMLCGIMCDGDRVAEHSWPEAVRP